MAKHGAIALSLALISSLYGGTVHGFTLLSEDEKAVSCSDRESPPAFVVAQEGAAGDNRGRSSGQEQPSYAVEPVFSLEFPTVLVKDAVYAATSPFGWDKKDWLLLGAGIAAVAAVSFADTHVRNQVLRIQSASGLDAAGQIRRFGGTYSFATLGLFLAGGEIFGKPTATAVFIDGAAASLISGGITLGLKYAVGRARPSADLGNSFYQPFSGKEQSFPSGEVTQAFAVASVIATHYDELWIKIASYGIATLVGMARMYRDEHWASDAFAGALVGTAVGIALVHFNDRRRSKPERQTRFLIAPLMAGNATGVGMVMIY